MAIAGVRVRRVVVKVHVPHTQTLLAYRIARTYDTYTTTLRVIRRLGEDGKRNSLCIMFFFVCFFVFLVFLSLFTLMFLNVFVLVLCLLFYFSIVVFLLCCCFLEDNSRTASHARHARHEHGTLPGWGSIKDLSPTSDLSCKMVQRYSPNTSMRLGWMACSQTFNWWLSERKER